MMLYGLVKTFNPKCLCASLSKTMNFANKLLKLRFGCLYKTICKTFTTEAVTISSDKESIEITLQNRKEKFPLVWLRDNCTCEKCYHKQSISRIINWNEFDTNIAAKSVEVSIYI